MTKDEALTMCLEYIETDKHERKYVRHAIKAALEQAEPPPEWEAINNIIAEYGLQAIDFVADWKAAQPVQEPVGYVYWSKGHAEGAIDVQTLKPGTPLYTAPPQRKPLTEQEIDALANNNGTVDLVTWWRQLARAIEAAHNIKEKP